LKFTVEEPKTEVDPPATPPGESEPLCKVEFFSATSIGDQGDSAHVMQAHVGGAGNYGDSGVEADLCALSILDPEEVEVLSPEPDLAQAENVEVHLDCSNGNPAHLGLRALAAMVICLFQDISRQLCYSPGATTTAPATNTHNAIASSA